MKFTFYGHACFSIELNGKTLLFDPFISGNELAKDIDINNIKADYILLSHGHADHVADVETIVKNNPNLVLISNFEIVNWFSEKGINGHPMNHGGKWQFEFGTVHYVNAVHTSSMPDGSYGGQPGGFVVKNDNQCIYYAGDTALTYDMKLIPLTIGKPNIAILPIGDNFTMGVDDAVKASEFVECNKIIGVHYDTFGFIKINHEEAVESFNKQGKELILLNIGETKEI